VGTTGATGPTGAGASWVSAPAHVTSTGTAGQEAYDANYHYICVATNTWIRVRLINWEPVFTWVSNGDANGVFYYLGALAGGGTWINPHTAGQCIIAASNLSSGTLASVVDRVSSDAFDNPQAGNWWSVDLGSTRVFVPTKYSYRQRSAGGNLMTQMKLQGSNDNSSWADISTADSPTQTADVWTTFTVTGSTAYRYLRLLRTANDSSANTYFTIGEWEMYGTLTT
jgi:hypothetical protein